MTSLTHGGSPRQPVAFAFTSALESALVYGAVANILAFAVPLLHRPSDASLAFAVLAQALVAAAAFAVTAVGVSAAYAWRRFSGPAAASTPDDRYSMIGPGALVVIALLMGMQLHERALAGAGLVALVLLAATAAAARRWPDRGAGRIWINWVAATLLAAVPFLAQPRAGRGWPSTVAAIAAIAVIVLSACVVLNWYRGSGATTCYRRTRGIALAALCLAGLLPGWLAQQQEPSFTVAPRTSPPSGHPPNIILITLDTVRADHLSVYGYALDTTPTLRALWQQGATRYARAFSTSDMTLSSHASIFTGLMPSEHGAHRRGTHPDTGLPASAETVAARLRAAGFLTIGIAANASYLSSRFGFDAGFDYYDAHRPIVLTAPYPSYFFGGTFVFRLLRLAGPDYQWSYRSADALTRQAASVLSQAQDSGRPFFLFLNLMDAHTPTLAPTTYRQRFGARVDGSYWLQEYPRLVREINAAAYTITPNERARMIASYDAAISYMDAELGRFFDVLARQGLLENTVVMITSDHGELFGRSGALGHDGLGIARGLFHVPLLIKYPGTRQPSSVDTPVSAIDLYPTILDLAEVPGPRAGEGRSLIGPSASTDRMVLLESFESAWLSTLNPRFRGTQRAALVGDRLILAGRQPSVTVANWLPPGSTSTPPPDSPSTERAYAALRRLEDIEALEHGSPARAGGKNDRLRSLGYVMR